MPNVREPIKESSKEKKQRIINIGFKLMCKKGYHNVSCVDIAKVSNVSTGIIYQYFEDKLDIFIAGTNLYCEQIMFPMLNAFKNRQTNKNNLDKILRKTIDDSIKAHIINKDAHKEIISMSYLEKSIFNILSLNEEMVTKKILHNFPDSPNIKEKVHLLINLVDNLCHEIVYHHHEGYNYEYMKENTIQMIENMMEDVYEN